MSYAESRHTCILRYSSLLLEIGVNQTELAMVTVLTPLSPLDSLLHHLFLLKGKHLALLAASVKTTSL